VKNAHNCTLKMIDHSFKKKEVVYLTKTLPYSKSLLLKIIG